MTRPDPTDRAVLRRPVGVTGALLGLLLVLLGTLLAAVPVRAEEALEPDVAEVVSPLTVHLDQLSPAAIPQRGRLLLAGTVTNNSVETWSAINVDPFLSRSPMTTREELAAAAVSDPAAEVGRRLTRQGQFDPIGDLAPGESASFQISLRVRDLIGPEITGEPGVYWIGVHALGQNKDGRDTLADGRARTFIPLIDRQTARTQQTSVAVVVPVRERVRRDSAGRVLGTTTWAQELSPSGRLGRIGAFLESATAPTTLLLDPAVLDAVADLQDENPPISLGTNPDPAEPTPTPGSEVSRNMNRLEPADRVNAENWLDAVVASARRHPTLGLAYGDPDTAALARRRPALLRTAADLAADAFSDLGINAQPAIAPPAGWFDADLLDRVAAGTALLVSDQSAPRTRSRWTTTTRQDLIFTDQQAGNGGPGPNEPTDALALRQRIISDAALRLPSRNPSPMVVTLPDDWDPGQGWQLADFFDALDQPWLDLVDLRKSALVEVPVFTAALGYPRAVRRAELDVANMTAARTVLQTGTVLAEVLRTENTIARDLGAVAMTAVSVHARDEEVLARQQVLSTDARMREVLDGIEVIGTDFVTLSGGSGSLAVTLVNNLEHPVVVGVAARTTNSGVRIENVAPLEMAPGQRTVLRLQAKSTGIGVEDIALVPVTTEGTSFGTPLSFRLRTSQVGNLIWGVLGAGALLLVVMIARRVRRGLREHKWRLA